MKTWQDDLAAMRAASDAIAAAVVSLEAIAREIPAINQRRIKLGLTPVDAAFLFSAARQEAAAQHGASRRRSTRAPKKRMIR